MSNCRYAACINAADFEVKIQYNGKPNLKKNIVALIVYARVIFCRHVRVGTLARVVIGVTTLYYIRHLARLTVAALTAWI